MGFRVVGEPFKTGDQNSAPLVRLESYYLTELYLGLITYRQVGSTEALWNTRSCNVLP
jgi:hypothetical protein